MLQLSFSWEKKNPTSPKIEVQLKRIGEVGDQSEQNPNYEGLEISNPIQFNLEGLVVLRR